MGSFNKAKPRLRSATIKLSNQCKVPILATGGDEKATPALAKNGYAIFGQYVGDLKNVRTMDTIKGHRSLESAF